MPGSSIASLMGLPEEGACSDFPRSRHNQALGVPTVGDTCHRVQILGRAGGSKSTAGAGTGKTQPGHSTIVDPLQGDHLIDALDQILRLIKTRTASRSQAGPLSAGDGLPDCVRHRLGSQTSQYVQIGWGVRT